MKDRKSFTGLSSRSINVICGQTDLENVDALKRAIESGEFSNGYYKGSKLKGFDKKSFFNCCEFLGFNLDKLPKPKNFRSKLDILSAFKLSAGQLKYASRVMQSKSKPVLELCKELNVSRQTLYSYLAPDGVYRDKARMIISLENN